MACDGPHGRDVSGPAPAEDAGCCDRCGCADAVRIAGRWLCVDCYQVCGSCCPGPDEREREGRASAKAASDAPGAPGATTAD